MFKRGRYYLCVARKNESQVMDSSSLNLFISALFNDSKNKTRNIGDSTAEYGLLHSRETFHEGQIYYCPIDGILTDANGNLAFVGKYSNEFIFEEIEHDNLDIRDVLKKQHQNCIISVVPSFKFFDSILYKCKVIVYGHYKGIGVVISEDKLNGIRLAYREARKNLLTKTKLYKALTHRRDT